MSALMTVDEAEDWLGQYTWADLFLVPLRKGTVATVDWLEQVNALRHAMEPDCPRCAKRVLSKRIAIWSLPPGVVTLARGHCEHCGNRFYVDQNGNPIPWMT